MQRAYRQPFNQKFHETVVSKYVRIYHMQKIRTFDSQFTPFSKKLSEIFTEGNIFQIQFLYCSYIYVHTKYHTRKENTFTEFFFVIFLKKKQLQGTPIVF